MLQDYYNDKIYQLYYDEVGQVALLKPEQERQLLQRYHTCPSCKRKLPNKVKAMHCPKCKGVAPDEPLNRIFTCSFCYHKFDAYVVPLFCPYCGSERDADARHQLIVSNLRFVIKRAKSIATNPEHVKRLISAGNVGLMLAIDKFCLDKNTRFLTYAEWWIRKEMLDEIHASNLVHVPTHRQKSLRKEQKEGKFLCTRCGLRTNTPDETEKLPSCKYKREHQFILPINNDAAVLNDALSLDELTSSETVLSHHSNLHKTGDIEDRTIDANVGELLQDVLHRMKMSERDRFIITGYFNVPAPDRKTEPKSLHQLSSLTGITPERVRQVKEQVLDALKKELKKSDIQEVSQICV